MTAREMIDICRENEVKYTNIARLAESQGDKFMKTEYLYTVQFFGNVREIIEDYLYCEGEKIDFLFKAFELREKEYAAWQLKKPEPEPHTAPAQADTS